MANRHRLSAAGILYIAKQLSEVPGKWKDVARELGCSDSFIQETEELAEDDGRSEEVEFLHRWTIGQCNFDRLFDAMNKAGLSEVSQYVKDTKNHKGTIVTLHFKIETPRGTVCDEFCVESLGSAKLHECLKPYCDEMRCTVNDLEVFSPKASLFCDAYKLQNDLIRVRLMKQLPEQPQKATAERKTRTLEPSSGGLMRRHRSASPRTHIISDNKPLTIRTSRRSRLRIYITTFQQMGNHNKIYAHMPTPSDDPPNSDEDIPGGTSDASSDVSQVPSDSHYGARNQHNCTQSDPQDCCEPYSSRICFYNYPACHYDHVPPEYNRGPAPRIWLDNRIPVLQTSLITDSSESASSTLSQAPPRPPPHPTSPKKTPRPPKAHHSADSYMSDNSDDEDQKDSVVYENVINICHATNHKRIPHHIYVKALKTTGFWDLPNKAMLERALKRLVDRFGDKDGRFIVWRGDDGRRHFVASVTCNGELKHFQIVWKEKALTIHDRDLQAPDLRSLLEELRNTPLTLANGIDTVTLRSAIHPGPDDVHPTSSSDHTDLTLSNGIDTVTLRSAIHPGPSDVHSTSSSDHTDLSNYMDMNMNTIQVSYL